MPLLSVKKRANGGVAMTDQKLHKYILTIDTPGRNRTYRIQIATSEDEARKKYMKKHPAWPIVHVEEKSYEICQVCYRQLETRTTHELVCPNVTCSEYWGNEGSS